MFISDDSTQPETPITVTDLSVYILSMSQIALVVRLTIASLLYFQSG